MEHITPLKLLINEIFNIIKDQPWVRRLRPIQYNPSLPRSEEYCSYHDRKGHQPVYYWALQKYLEELIQQDFLKEYFTPEAVFRQLNTQPSRE